MPDRLPPLIDAVKTLSSTPKWAEQEDQFTFTVALDIDGITQMGLRLRGKCSRDFPDKNITFQIEYIFRGRVKPAPVTRIDWRPLHPHQNRNIGPAQWRLQSFHCSHIHPFSENHEWMVGNGLPLADNIKQNLPIAMPLDNEPDGFKSLVTMVGKSLKIEGVDVIPVPPWKAPRLL